MVDYSLPTNLDRLIHNPGRLAILAVLAGVESADFTFLQETTEINKGTLSKHLSSLEQAGYIKIKKQFIDNRPNTSASLTPDGRKALNTYRRRYQRFLKSIGSD
ncbi:MAG: transcriptional regulator [Anaerolineales bacterium]|jgi:DNA-binding MarR family transcriptional regulator